MAGVTWLCGGFELNPYALHYQSDYCSIPCTRIAKEQQYDYDHFKMSLFPLCTTKLLLWLHNLCHKDEVACACVILIRYKYIWLHLEVRTPIQLFVVFLFVSQ